MAMLNLSVSLIVSTYNWPKALNLCLLSIKRQVVLPNEVIIADDGSTGETKELIDQYRKDFPVPIIHIWQKDDGFQLSRIRNKAIAKAMGEYIIQVDGDLILEKHFVKDHLSFSRKNTFVSGSRVIISKDLSERLLDRQEIKVYLTNRGLINQMNGLRLPFLSEKTADYKKADIYYLRGCNMAFWRQDLIRVNGYNEAFSGWGREDNEIGLRLINSGVDKRIIKFSGIVYHIYHPEKTRIGLEVNDQILKQTARNHLIRTELGLNQYLK